MVRNLVLTPFIDLPCAHFMFCGEKMTEFFELRDEQPIEANPDCMDQLFALRADKPIDGGNHRGEAGMIELTRLNGEHMVVNSDLIRYAEASPDTVITLVTGDKIVVTESTRELIERVVAFRSRLLRTAFANGKVAVDPTESISAMSASTAQAVAAVLPQSNTHVDQDEGWRRRRRESD